MAKIIVPVGYPAGAIHPAEGEDEELQYSVIIGKDLLASVPPDLYPLWQLLFTDPDAHRELAFTREHFGKLAEVAGYEVPHEALANLEEISLFAEYEPTDKSSITFLKKHRLVPQGEGIGNTAEDPTMFHVRVGGEIAISLMFDFYTLWMGADNWPNMWEMVKSYSKHRTGAPFNTEELGMLFASSIPAIVAASTGYLTRPL